MGYGAAAAAVISVAASVAGYFLKPKAPSYDTKQANKDLKSYQSNVSDLWSKGLPQAQFHYTPQDMQNAATSATNYNQANLPQYQDMAKSIYDADVSNKMSAIAKIDPSLTSQVAQISANNLSYINGEIPQDVQASIARAGAYANVKSGMGGQSGVGVARTARDLGVTSTQLANQGSNDSRAWAQALNGMLPTQTSANDIMKNNGISSTQAINTTFGAAQQDLAAQEYNIGQDYNVLTQQDKMYGNILNQQGSILANDFNSKSGIAASQTNAINNLTSGIGSAAAGYFSSAGGKSAANAAGKSIFGGA